MANSSCLEAQGNAVLGREGVDLTPMSHWSQRQQTRVKALRWFQGHQNCVLAMSDASDTQSPPLVQRHQTLPWLHYATQTLHSSWQDRAQQLLEKLQGTDSMQA